MLLFFVGLLLKHESGTTAPHPLSSQTLKEAPDRAQACWEYTSSKKLAQNTVPHKSSSTFQTTANRSDQKSSTKPVLFLRHREVRPQRLLSCATASSVSEKPDCETATWKVRMALILLKPPIQTDLKFTTSRANIQHCTRASCQFGLALIRWSHLRLVRMQNLDLEVIAAVFLKGCQGQQCVRSDAASGL